MGPETAICLLPVYRRSFETFEAEMARERSQYGTEGSFARRWYDESKWYPRKYNDVVAWIEVYALGDQIRGEEWWVRARRLSRKMRHRHFLRSGKAFELSFDPADPQQAIQTEVASTLRDLGREPRYRRRHIDIEAFLELAPFIRWRALLGFEPV